MLKKELESKVRELTLENKDLRKQLKEWEDSEPVSITEMSKDHDSWVAQLQQVYRERDRLENRYVAIFGIALFFIGLSIVLLAYILNFGL